MKDMTENLPGIDEVQAPTGPRVHNGTFTVSHPQHGYFIVKLHTAMKGRFAGRRIISLTQSATTRDGFKGVAFWDDKNHTAVVWARCRGPQSTLPVDGDHWQIAGWSRAEQKLAIWTDLVLRGDNGYWQGKGYSVLLKGRCVVCNRELTKAESIRSGIGPVCASRA